MTGERLPPHDKEVLINAIVTAKVRARKQRNDSSWLKICSQLPEIVDRVNSGSLSPECCDGHTLGGVINYYWKHKAEIHSVLDPKLEHLPDLQATVAAQWQAAIQVAPDGSPKQWRRWLVDKFGYSEDQMRRGRRGPKGIIRVIVDKIEINKGCKAWREAHKGKI